MSFHSLLILQTVIGLLGIIPAYMLGIASVMSAANAQEHPRLASFVIVLGLALPVVLAVSLIVMWITHAYGYERAALTFLTLPWAHLMLVIASTLSLFRK